MCNALGIITYNDSSVYVEGMQKYRPIAGFSFLGRYRCQIQELMIFKFM